MGFGRLGVAAGVVSFASYITVEIFQQQGWTMPDQLAAALVALAILMGGIAALVVVYEIWRLFIGRLQGYRLRSPLVRKDAPDPNQWLLNIAKTDENSPTSAVCIVGRRIRSWKLEARRPHVEFGITVYNGSVYDIEFSGIRGPISFRGEPLETEPEKGGGITRIARGQSYELRILQYIPKEIIEEVHKELAGGITGSFGISGATIEVRTSTDTAQSQRMSIGGNDRVTVGDQ